MIYVRRYIKFSVLTLGDKDREVNGKNGENTSILHIMKLWPEYPTSPTLYTAIFIAYALMYSNKLGCAYYHCKFTAFWRMSKWVAVEAEGHCTLSLHTNGRENVHCWSYSIYRQARYLLSIHSETQHRQGRLIPIKSYHIALFEWMFTFVKKPYLIFTLQGSI